MKRTLLLIFTAFSLLSNATGQTYSVQHDTVSQSSSGTSTMYLHNYITTTQAAVPISWKITGHNLPADWINNPDMGLCDNNLCYGSAYFSNGMWNIDTVKSTKAIDMKLQVKPDGGHTGTYYVSVNVRDMPSTINSTITYIINKWPTGVTTVTRSEDNVTIYPNPAREALNVVFDESLGVKNIAVYNLIGKIVSIYKVSSNSAKLDLTDIPTGIYFVRLMNAQGQIVATRRFTH
ncbi:MAG: T9SS type A sorting domain-containing protein [Chitinophagaceae bacterium]|nr:MAG: T9SS type A sorting domain-containing protein [Chitinophagaceae bacterium]